MKLIHTAYSKEHFLRKKAQLVETLQKALDELQTINDVRDIERGTTLFKLPDLVRIPLRPMEASYHVHLALYDEDELTERRRKAYDAYSEPGATYKGVGVKLGYAPSTVKKDIQEHIKRIALMALHWNLPYVWRVYNYSTGKDTYDIVQGVPYSDAITHLIPTPYQTLAEARQKLAEIVVANHAMPMSKYPY